MRILPFSAHSMCQITKLKSFVLTIFVKYFIKNAFVCLAELIECVIVVESVNSFLQ